MIQSQEPGQVHQRVVGVLALVLGIDPAPLTLAREGCPQWDSLAHVQIVFALEDAFGVSFSLEELSELTDSETIARLVADRLGA
jgi:acyl carrier protein